MRTRNPNYNRSIRTTEGGTSARRAGGNLRIKDATGTDIVVSTLTLSGGVVTEVEDGDGLITISGGVTAVGVVTAGGSPATVSSGTSYRAFPGVCWLDNPTATVHTTGDRFLVVYRDGTGHLTAGNIKGVIATVTNADTWTYTLGSAFTIEDVTNDLRCEDAASVVDISGTGDYRVVIAAREYNEATTVTLNPHILISAVAPGSVTSSTSWTRYEGPTWNGTTDNYTASHVRRLANGTYLCPVRKVSAGTNTNGVAIVSDPTDWSSPTFYTIASGYNELDIEEMPDGTLIAHMRDAAQTYHYSSHSTDSGATWSTPTQLYAAGGYPAWRRLTSGIGLAVHRNGVDILDTAWRQTASAITDGDWGDETILDTTGTVNQYATILQLDDTHALVIYAVEMSSTDADIYSQVFTDSSVLGGANLLVSSTDTTSGFLVDKLLASSGITLTQGNTGGAETLTVAANGGATTTDTGGYFATSTVEGNLQELGADIASIEAGTFAHSEIAVLGDAGPTPLLNDDSTDYLYVFPTG